MSCWLASVAKLSGRGRGLRAWPLAAIGLLSAGTGLQVQALAQADLSFEKRQPHIRAVALPAQENHAFAALELQALEPLGVLVLDAPLPEQALRIVAGQHGRTLLGQGDRGYARTGVAQPQTPAANPALPNPTGQYSVFRQATPIRDPQTQAVLAYEALYLGVAQRLDSAPPKTPTSDQVEAPQPPQDAVRFEIVTSVQDIHVGDYLWDAQPTPWVDRPKPSTPPNLSAHVASIYGGATFNATQKQVVVLNRGSQHGLRPGQTLEVWNQVQAVPDANPGPSMAGPQPLERKATLQVLRTFAQLAYALILRSTDVVKIGDEARPLP